jgi:hypothetical protein
MQKSLFFEDNFLMMIKLLGYSQNQASRWLRIMKRVFLIIGFSLGAVAFSLIISYPNQPFAVTGCCKARESYRKLWYRNNMTFKECEGFNKEVDRDDVFEESGQVWWDVVCESR